MPAIVYPISSTTAAARDAVRQAEVPLSDARRTLDQAIARLAGARRDAETASAPVRRLETISAEHDRIAAEVQRLRGEDTRRVGEWLAGGSVGPRPSASRETVTAEIALAEVDPDCRAASAVAPAALAAQRAAMDRTVTAQVARLGLPGRANAGVAIDAPDCRRCQRATWRRRLK